MESPNNAENFAAANPISAGATNSSEDTFDDDAPVSSIFQQTNTMYNHVGRSSGVYTGRRKASSMMLELPEYRSHHESRRANSDASSSSGSTRSVTGAGADLGEDKENDGLVAALEINGSGHSPLVTSWKQCPWDKWSPKAEQVVPVWFHVDYNNPEAQRWLRDSGPQGANIGRSNAKLMLDMHSTPCCRVTKDMVYISLRGINFNPGRKHEDMVNLHMLATRTRLITTRHLFVRAVQHTRKQLVQTDSDGPENVGQVISVIVYRLIYIMRDPIERLELKLANFEERSLSENLNPKKLRGPLNALRRRIIGLNRFLLPHSHTLEDVLKEVIHHTDIFDERCKDTLKQCHILQLAHVRRLQVLMDRAKVVEQDLVASVQQKLNNTLFALTIISASSILPQFILGVLSIFPENVEQQKEKCKQDNVAGVCYIIQSQAMWQQLLLLLFVLAIFVLSVYGCYRRYGALL